MNKDTHMNIKEVFSLKITKDEEESKMTIEGTVPKEKIATAYTSVLEQVAKQKEVDGFRKGKADASTVEAKVDSFELWKRSANEVIMDVFPNILIEEKIAPLGTPDLQLTSIVDKGEVGFKVSFFVMPNITIPDYSVALKGIERENETPEVTEDDVQSVVRDVRRSLYKKEHPDKDIPEDETQLPEITDEYVREISTTYKDVPTFLQGVREGIAREKKIEIRSRFREKILDALLAHTKISIPKNVIEEESKRTYEDMKTQAKTLNTTIEEYLKSQKMTEEQLWQNLREDAKKRSSVQFILNTISTKENIHADSEDVERELERFKQRADENMTEKQVRVYLESVLGNEAVMQFLEGKIAK